MGEESGSYVGAAPPLGGLGNYKGVMLCNRPPDDLSRPHGGDGGGQPPFKSTIAPTASEQLGLQPAKQLKLVNEVKTRGPSAALRRHCQWIKELQQQVHEDQRQLEDSKQAQEQRKLKMSEAFKQQRDAIREIKSDRHRSTIDPTELEGILRPAAKKAAAPRALPAQSKPLWAMTEDEREGCEDEEAEALIQFAEGLDFEQYIDDLEFKQCVQVVRDRAKRLQREQDAFKDSLVREFNVPTDADGSEHSNYGGDFVAAGGKHGDAGCRRSRPVGNDMPDWDSSTTCGDDRQSVAQSVHSAARVLEANPQLKAVHSKGSVQKLIEKAQGGLAPSADA